MIPPRTASLEITADPKMMSPSIPVLWTRRRSARSLLVPLRPLGTMPRRESRDRRWWVETYITRTNPRGSPLRDIHNNRYSQQPLIT
jgi:hypothetical protein